MEAQFRNIVSGTTTHLGATALRALFSAIAGPYRLTVAARNRLYDTGILRAHRVAVPVVSIGNITLGGTGKTPFVEFICRWFLARQKRPVILSRGYRSTGGWLGPRSPGRRIEDSEATTYSSGLGRGIEDSATATQQNDEAMLLAANLPGVLHLQGRDRVSRARQACELGVGGTTPDVIILDDGFQHRRLARDLDIVLIDCTEPFGYGRVFPRGMLREPISSLRRADLIVLTRADQSTSENLKSITRQIIDAAGEKPIVRAEHRPTTLRSAAGECLPLSTLAGRSVAAFCGIGNPSAFLKTLACLGCSIVAQRSFPDHHAYSPNDLECLAAWAKQSRCELAITTQKDLVKIPSSDLGGCPLYALQIEAAIDDPQSHLDRALGSLVQCHAGTSLHAA